ncbi:MAG: TonB-dependent receptor [Steroidobacteraceae bacterium]|nr:TonB-dependent receptor [Steroidobacteraceae bacterium]
MHHKPSFMPPHLAFPLCRPEAVRVVCWPLVACALAALPAAAATSGLEEIVVTATRQPSPALATPLSLSSVNRDALQLLGSTHHSEALNRLPGVMIQRGSGQESLTAIRSPVLTGAGSCGAFLFLENDVPIRPTGFCNVNELFEVNTEQAQTMEVLRGPGTALYGSSAMHGIVNVRQAAPGQLPERGLGVDLGPADFVRTKLTGSQATAIGDLGVVGLYTHDGGWRVDSGYDEVKLNATVAGRWWDTPSSAMLAATSLDQQTAGFITGQGAYRDQALRRQNLNPEAYREATAVRLTGLVQPAVGGTARLELRPYLRTSRMKFLQHFLLGKPLERNGQESAGLMTSLTWADDAAWTLVSGLDLELADSFLIEDQDGPTTDGTPPANAIRPAGRHYDYEVRSMVLALYAHGERRFAGRWRATAGVRAEAVHYDYDNRMLAGNTDENGVPCGTTGCLYSRPEDRSDAFINVAPKLGLALDVRDNLMAYVNASVGFRPPEITELYRLQRTQRAADLDSERLDSIEAGLKGWWPAVDFTVALFDMDKRNVILRETNGFNVSDGRTSHRGVEYELRWRPLAAVELTAAGTFARHRYEFSRAVEGGERIVDGNDVDTAPRDIHRVALGWQPGTAWSLEAEWLTVGEYWLDAANAHRYPGHELLNLRGRWQPSPKWALALRLNNALDRAYADRADYAFGTYRYFPGRDRALFAELAWRRD